MVSTRSQSVLSAGALGDTAGTNGEVSSAAAAPRRSTRSSGGAAATPAPRSTRSVRTRRQLANIQEEDGEGQQQQEQQEQAGPEEQPQAEKRTSGRTRRSPRTATAAAGAEAEAAAAPSPSSAAASQPDAAEEEAEADAEEGAGEQAAAAGGLKADAALVDVLAQQMFAALDGAFGQQQQGEDSASGSESWPDEDEDEEGSSQEESEGEEEAAAAAAAQQQAGHGSGSEDDCSGSDDERGAGRGVPNHLRWHPELTLPGQGGAAGAAFGAAAAAAGPAVGVHVVRRGSDGLHVPPADAHKQQRAARRDAPDTAGKGWFDLPATQVTDEVKNDLRMLRLRGALDPKAHYKKLDSTKFPKYFQMGTVVEGAADFYSGRLTKKQRKRTLTDEIMADANLTQVRKKRYTKLQDERSYWSKKKGPGGKTSNERRKKAHRRAKH